MKTKLVRLAVIIAVAVSAYLVVRACASAPGAKGELLAEFKGGIISRQEFEAAYDNLPERAKLMVRGEKSGFLESLVMEKLLLQEAEKRGLEKLDDVEDLMGQARKRILVAKLLDEEVDSKAQTTPEERRRYFEEHQKDFLTPYRMRASHILLRNREDAEQALARVGKGEDFAGLARELSLDPTGPKGGDIGYFQKGQLLEEIEEAAVALKPGETSGVIQSAYGFHIIKLTEVSEPQSRNFEAVEGNVEDKLLTEKKSQYFSALLDELKSKADIRTHEDLLSRIELTAPEGSGAGKSGAGAGQDTAS